MTDERKTAGSDAVNPPHYELRPGYEVYDLRQDLARKAQATGVPHDQHLDWDRALEYLLRMWQKGGLEDLRKAQWYLHQLEEKLIIRQYFVQALRRFEAEDEDGGELDPEARAELQRQAQELRAGEAAHGGLEPEDGRWYTAHDIGAVDEDGVPYVEDDGTLNRKSRYVATDESGGPHQFLYKPLPGKGEWVIPPPKRSHEYLFVTFTPAPGHYALVGMDWRKTLRRIKR